MARLRILTAEERALWRQATKNDARFQSDGEDEDENPSPSQRERLGEGGDAIDTGYSQHPLTPTLSPGGVEGVRKQLTIGDVHAMDGLTARRFRRGELPIDRVLDLHGYGRVEAYALLERHVRAMAENGERVLAIITGKGRTGEGVLKRELPHWLNDAPLRAHIVAACHAPTRMGGAGAVLVMLKRRRG